MELKLSNRVIDWAGFAATVLVGIGLGYPLLYGQILAQRTLAAEQQVLAARLANATEVMNAVSAGQELLAGLQKRNDSLQSKLPPTLQFQEFYQRISELANANHVGLTEVQPGTMTADLYYVMLPVTIRSESNFLDFYSFISELLADDRLIKIAKFEIRSAEDSDKCSVGLELMLYGMAVQGAA